MESDMEMDHRGRQLAREAQVVDGPTRARARANSLEEKKRNKRNIKGLALDSSALVSDNISRKSKVVVESGPAAPFTPIPSSILGRGVFSPEVASINRSKKPAPLPLDSLTQQFWASMTLASNSNASNASNDSASMVTAPEYPESAVEYDERLDMTLRSAAQPEIMYGNADGTVYSPALPVPGLKASKIRESLMSPAPVVRRTSALKTVVRRDFTAPSPNDPFAAFPSFATALGMGGMQASIQYPAKVAL
jgi:hypothetical protein